MVHNAIIILSCEVSIYRITVLVATVSTLDLSWTNYFKLALLSSTFESEL